MSVTLAPKADNDSSSSSGGLVTYSNKRTNKAQRLKKELDNFFNERSTKMSAYQDDYEYIDLYGYPIDTTHLQKIKRGDAEKYNIGVFSIENGVIKLATTNPSEKQKPIIDDLKKKTGYDVKIYLCSQRSFDKLLKTYNFGIDYREVKDDINLDEQMIEELSEKGINLKDLEKQARKISTSDLISMILIGALQEKASDIHFEPGKDDYILRLRLDGVLHVFGEFSKDLQHRIESRIKILSGLKLNVDNVPQDGRFSFHYKGTEIDVRVSMLPSNYGYSIVMRLLGTGNIALKLESLGFVGLAKKRIEGAMSKSQGMILTTGPTGSGKTTTLYTFLSEMNKGEEKIITLEDPIEYKLSGISQTQIDTEAGYTFASGLRSILRQDPDVVMVGEIRDEETADVAVQASLTGHKVLSTMHTNDAAGAVSRFMEMEIKGFLLADSINAVIGQRLVRRVCPHCKREAALTEKQKKIVLDALQTLPENAEVALPEELVFYTGEGCEECNGLGYKGRIGVYEVMVMTDGVRELLIQEIPSFVEIRRMAMKEGMVTMLQDSVLKALDGVTDLDEIMRAVV